MLLKNVCRLCLREDGAFYKLFNDCGKEEACVNELNAILDFKITKEEHFPDSICSNCYDINAFFKEFKDKCFRVNDYIKRKFDSGQVTSLGFTIKKEKTGHTGIVSDENVSNTNDYEGRASSEGDAPYPVALLTLSCHNNLEALRSSFNDGHNERVDVSIGSCLEKESQSTVKLNESNERRVSNNSKMLPESRLEDIPLELRATIKTEVFDDESEMHSKNYESDIEGNVRSNISAGEDLLSTELNSVTNEEDILDSEITFSAGNQVNDDRDCAMNVIRSATTGGCEKSSVLNRKRKSTVQVSDLNEKRRKLLDPHSICLSGTSVNHVVKQEEIDIYEPSVEEELNSYDSLDVEEFADEVYPSDCGESYRSVSSVSEDEVSSSSSSSSSDESDKETEMLLLLAMLM